MDSDVAKRNHLQGEALHRALLGTWRLVCGPPEVLTDGRLTYTSAGYVFIITSTTARGSYEPASLDAVTPEQALESVKNCWAYCGRFSVEGDRVRHLIELGTFSGWVGRDLAERRRVSIEGDRMSMEIADATVVWERLT